MSNLKRFYVLNNNIKIPSIGFGTAGISGDIATQAIHAAVEAGYRHIDTAKAYGNEADVGHAIKNCGVARKELFITGKLWNDDQGYSETLEAFKCTTEKLETDYLDLFLIHWPIPKKYSDDWQARNIDSWRAMEKLYDEGKIRTIGVSNFQKKHLEPLMEKARIQPMVNQVELHPGVHQNEVVAFCNANKIVVEAWSPLMHGGAIQLPQLIEIGKKYGKSTAQVCIRWSLQRGILPLPKSATPERIQQNIDVFDFELSPNDMTTINGLEYIGAMGPFPDDAAF